MNVYCTAASTCENEAKAGSPHVWWIRHSGRILPSSRFGTGGMLGQGEGRMEEKGKRALAISSCSPISHPFITLLSCFLTSGCISSVFNSILNLSLVALQGERQTGPRKGLANRITKAQQSINRKFSQALTLGGNEPVEHLGP